MDIAIIKKTRIKLKLTLLQVAELTGYSKGTISQLENGEKVSKRAYDKVVDILLTLEDGGKKTEKEYWKNRAIAAETRLEMIIAGVEASIKNAKENIPKKR